MTRLLALAGVLSLSALAVPALAAEEPVPVHGACAAAEGVTVLTPGATDERTVETPIGAGNDLVLDAASDAGTFVVDLAGLPKTQRGSLTFTLSWDNPLSDYDLVTNGSNELATDNPEVKTVTASHCAKVAVAVDVFVGLPVDALTLATTAR